MRMGYQYDRMVSRPPSWTPLLVCTAASAGLQLVKWGLTGGPLLSLSSPLTWAMLLVCNIALTTRSPRAKRALARTLQRWVVNPPVRLLLHLGVMPLGLALLETTGRTSGRRRRVPVGNGAEGAQFWLIAEHGWQAGYVRNIARDPHVRVRMRRGWRFVWVPGIATLLPHDDAWARQRQICRWHPLRMLNAMNVQLLGTAPMTVRIDLVDGADGPVPVGAAAAVPRNG